ncbi:CU044_5270 family protein [Streptomyces sp. KM273126]|uniref:CU044_5270 family protein n=1 Tax=Streptomyces sp. KM273126 TaxID=2545247 RepID=UPI00103EE833|nr:CU044_5270 family protein [Streptomyces sp. KM273126]MBA2808678.1 CU044_5270 family protein [Streptomyces sp. KM273126]
MNAAGSGPFRTEREDEAYEELTRLLPSLPQRDLPPGRHSHHKDRLMQLIDDDQSRTPAQSQSQSETPHTTRPRLRLLRPAVWVPAAALTLAGALTVGLVTNIDSGYGGEPSDGETAVVLLDRIADVAAKTEATPVRDDQLVYIKSLDAGAECQEDGPCEPGRLSEREAWWSQEPGPVKQLALFYEAGGYSPLRELLPPGSPGTPAGINRPTYKWLAALPTDPDELLDELYRLTKPVEGQEKAQAVFDKIGELLGNVMPPRTAAALYEAAAKIPGVKRVEDAVDPAGRHGVGIRRVDKRSSWATVWIFDRDTLAYLGERTYLTKDSQTGKKGTVLGESAILKRAVVDEYRQRPGSPRPGSGSE